jgi:outer membrane protein assembly factor BamD (BamD/ComL family)
MSLKFLLFSVIALLVAFTPFAGAEAKAYEESEKKHWWFSLSRPAKKTPEEQLAWARQLHEQGRLRKATRAYRALAVTWPGSPEALLGRLGLAQTLDERGKLEDAFDAYHELATRFTGGYSYDQVVKRQFEIARETMERRRGGFLFFGGFRAPERAVPMFEKTLQNAPRAPFAAEAQYLIGRAYEESDQLELAVVAYMTAQHRYPTSPWAPKAAFGRARALVRLSEESPNDEEALEEAWAAVVLFINMYPQSDDIDVAKAYRDTLLRRRARAAYDKAVFYDRIARRPVAAWRAYDNFVRQFPNSEWTAIARARMDSLSPLVENQNESN